jgi:hypothetical protein
MILVMGGRFLKLLYAIFTLLLHLKPALGFISGVGDGNMWCIERERQALLEFKKALLMTMERSLHGEVNMQRKIAAVGKEFGATTKQAM